MRRRLGRLVSAELWKVWGPMLLVVVVGFLAALLTVEPAPPKHLKIAAGDRGGAYYAFASRYREIVARQGYDLEVLETPGSVENLRLLGSGEVDLALVQGGTLGTAANTAALEALANLFLEPLWLFFDRSLDVENLADLRGRRVALGAPQSGTRELARRLLDANGLEVNESDELVEIGAADAAAALERGDLDAAFFVASIQAPYVERLLSQDRFRLLPVRRHRAYHQRYSFLSRVVLGEGTVDLARNLPAADVELIAAACSLVARRDLNQALVPLLLETMQEVHGDGGVFAEPGAFPALGRAELAANVAARRYLEHGPPFLLRFLPFRFALALDRLKIFLLPLLTLLIPVLKAAPPIYRWRMRSKIYRWYEDLRRLEEVLRREAPETGLDTALRALDRLEREVSEQVSVPLAYMDELYHLQLHVELIRTKLERRQHRGRSQAVEVPASDPGQGAPTPLN